MDSQTVIEIESKDKLSKNLKINKSSLALVVKLLVILSLWVAFSCAQKVHPGETVSETVVYPSPPDTPRIQYLTSISGSFHVTGKQSAFKEYVVGKEPSRPVIKPYGIHAVKSKLFVCDVDLKGLEIIDFEHNSFEYFTPSGRGSLRLPINCFLDEKGYLYVADAGRMEIVIFDQNLKFYNAFGEKENFKPTDVFVANGKIWVTNLKKGIHVYDQETLKPLFVFPEYEPGGESNIYQATNIWVTKEEVYVSDFGEFNVKVFSLEGQYKRTIGSFGSGLGQFIRPKGIAVDRNANLYVVDGGFEITQVFNEEGKLLLYFGGPYKGPGDMWLPVKVTLDYENMNYFKKYLDPDFDLEYLIYITNQYGPDKISVYGFIRQPITNSGN